MERSTSRHLVVPVLLGLVVVAILGYGFISGAGRSSEPDGEPSAGGPVAIWRCHACARIQGQNWQSCRTVTGRGTEQAARDLVRQRVCEEASNPEAQCSINQIDCRELPESSAPDLSTKSGH